MGVWDMARKQKNNVDYFPHDCTPNKIVRIISRKYGNDGYALYYRLKELLGLTEFHNYSLEDEIDWEDFLCEMNVDETLANEVIEFLVKNGELDGEMWAKKRLYSQTLVNDLASVYSKRKNMSLPNKNSYLNGNKDSRAETGVPEPVMEVPGAEVHKVKESKFSKGEESTNHPPQVDLEQFSKEYPEIDVKLSYQKFHLNQQRNNRKVVDEKAEFKLWLMRDKEEGWNLRAVAKTGRVGTRHCPNGCESRDIVLNEEYKGVFCGTCGNQMVSDYELPLSIKLSYENENKTNGDD